MTEALKILIVSGRRQAAHPPHRTWSDLGVSCSLATPDEAVGRLASDAWSACLVDDSAPEGGRSLLEQARGRGLDLPFAQLSRSGGDSAPAPGHGFAAILPDTLLDEAGFPALMRLLLERHRLARELQQTRDSLDHCVMNRTTELHQAVEALQREVENRKQIEDKLRAAVIRLERHNVAKTEFVANVSHELKTPLTSMIYGVRNLLKGIAGPLPDHAVRYLKLFDTECQRLIATINDILDLAKIENHTLTLAPITTPLNYLVRRCTETLEAQAGSARVTLVTDIHPGAPFVRCDPNMIQRVLVNILGNALKFTPRGGTITVTVRAEYPMARITVTDTGSGIPPDALDRVTERYFRADNRSSGSGLGLSISKEIMHLHGGVLTLASPPPDHDHGTAVSITLPLAEPPTVLVGDDNPVILDLVRIHLGKEGYNVITASSGQEVILMAEASKPDVILLDLILEDIHGTTVILSLRGAPQIRYIPIIAITGATLDQATSDILTRFSVPTLPKPWNACDLVATVDAALMGKTAFQSPASMEVHHDPGPNPAHR